MNVLKIFIMLLLLVSVKAYAEADLGFKPPLATDARKNPEKTPNQIQYERDEAERVKYSVLYGSHNFDSLEQAAKKIIDLYSSKQIDADDFILKLYLLVPERSGKAHIEDILEWTKKKPKSYPAWYVLGRQYLNLAKEARGSKWAKETPKEQFNEMDKYARLSQNALLQSLKLYNKPIPSYRTLIQTHHLLIDNQSNKDYEYLQEAIKADSNSKLIYILYFIYNTPRWGGDFDVLKSVLDNAKKTKISKQNLLEVEAELIELQGDDAIDLENNPTLASELYKKAFDINPIKENIFRLYDAARNAKKANNINEAIGLFSKIIQINPLEHDAFFERGVIYREENRDLKQHFLDMIASAKLGNKYAQNNIGYYYLTGDKGFPVNLHQAKEWLQLSANQGYDHARNKLSVVEEELKKLTK
jgi:TPR repeat protein